MSSKHFYNLKNFQAFARLSSHANRSPKVESKYFDNEPGNDQTWSVTQKWTLVLCKNFHLKLIRPLNWKFNKTQKPEFRWTKPCKIDFEYFWTNLDSCVMLKIQILPLKSMIKPKERNYNTVLLFSWSLMFPIIDLRLTLRRPRTTR